MKKAGPMKNSATSLIPLTALAVLVGCADLENPPPAAQLPAPSEDTCNANSYADLIGQDATALERVMILGQVRVIRPGMAVTMDYRPERINFNITQDGLIGSIACT